MKIMVNIAHIKMPSFPSKIYNPIGSHWPIPVSSTILSSVSDSKGHLSIFLLSSPFPHTLFLNSQEKNEFSKHFEIACPSTLKSIWI